MDKQSLELLLAQGASIESIANRFGKDPSTVSYWMNKHGLESPYRQRHAAKGGLPRERLAELVEAGMTIAEMAEAVSRSTGTVRYWLRRYGLRTQNARGRRSRDIARAGKEAGHLTVRMQCPRHGRSEFQLEGRGYYRCKQCRCDAVARRRRKVKEILVSEAGGCCRICGYDRCMSALAFHHLDPDNKRLEINAKGVALALHKLREEAKKCALLCANCHAEVEQGLASVPGTVRFLPLGQRHPETRRSLHHNPG